MLWASSSSRWSMVRLSFRRGLRGFAERKSVFSSWRGEYEILRSRRSREEIIFYLPGLCDTYIENNSSQPPDWGSGVSMRFLPVFLDLEAGPIFLVGAGELAQAKLRLLLAAGARVRWHAVDGNYDASALNPIAAATLERCESDPLTADLNSVIAVLCA